LTPLRAIGHKAAEVLCCWRQARRANDHDKAPAIDRYEGLARNRMAFHECHLQRHGKGAGMENAHQGAGISALGRDAGKVVIALRLAAIGGKYPGPRLGF